MRRISLLLFALLFIVNWGCKSSESATSKTSTADKAAVPEDFQLFITRTGCFGKCPVYELFVDTDGRVLYQGHANVDNVGKFQKQLSPQQLQQLVSTLREGDFFGLDETYDDGVTDLPTVITEAIMDGKRHKVTNRTGPPSVESLQDRLDAIIGTEGYKAAEKK